MNHREVNLARRPFSNSRPVVRISVVLWALGLLLALANAFLYGRSFSGMEETEERIVATRAAIEEEGERIAAAEERLREMDLREQNAVAEYLNDRIEERTFPWSRLFDHLAEVLPREVRLHNLRPRRLDPGEGRAGRSERAADGELVGLAMTGQAQSDEALLRLLDNLFASEWFEDPQLASETREADNTLRFQLTVTYLPATVEAREAPVLGWAAAEGLDESDAPVRPAPGGRPEPALPGEIETDPSSPDRRAAAPPEAVGPRPETATSEGRTVPGTGGRNSSPVSLAPGSPASRDRATGDPAEPPRPGPATPTPLRPAASRPGGFR